MLISEYEQKSQRLRELQLSHGRVRISYTDASGRETRRTIEPLRIYQNANRWYVRAYCRLRGDERTFAIGRMSIMEVETREEHCVQPQANAEKSGSPLETRAASQSYKENKSGRTPFGFFFGTIAVVLAVIYLSGIFSEVLDYSSSSRSEDYGSGEEQADSGGSSRDSGAKGERVPVKQWRYRGYTLHKLPSGRVEIPSLGIEAGSGARLHYAINAYLFFEETEIEDKELFRRYIDADSDGNGHLSWPEISDFQKETARSFRYRSNSIALPPDEFLARGGGDCEDFALYTAGMLRFWGWNCKVASYYPPEGVIGHAIALVWSNRPIPGYGYFKYGKGVYAGGRKVRPGYWIPIDYEAVGGITEAMEANWELRDLSEPESLYRQTM